ncbi:MAG: hypothetical protein FD170_2753 [Bacteroidetes bacterium]|nr:MAG: hypothetical protein FD170_2753 [Bacteroidota bacterium]
MKIIDFLYFVSYHAYVRGNKESMGAFMINSLWISALQFFLLFSFLVFVEVKMNNSFLDFLYNINFFILTLGFIILINNIYLLLFKRRMIILNRFQMSEKILKIYWFLIIGIFFICFILFSYSSYLRKETFGW